MNYTKCHNLLCEDRLTVFLLHGIISSNDYRFRNYNRKHILLKEFDHLLSELTRHGTPITMDQVADYCQSGGFPKNAFAITFDDGFKNNLTNAAPLLIKHNVPATFYLTTSFVDKNLMSWTDRIDLAIENSGDITNTEITVPWKKTTIPLRNPEEKRLFLEDVRAFVKKSPKINGHHLADAVQEQLGHNLIYSSESELDQKLSWEEARELAEYKSFTVGAHSHSHEILSFMPADELRQDLDTCILLLKQNLGLEVKHFAYPEGQSHHYNDSVIQSLKSRGIVCCPTAEHGNNGLGNDLYKIKRVFVD